MPDLIHLALHPPRFIHGGTGLPGLTADPEPLGLSSSRDDRAQDDLQEFNNKALQKGHGDFPRHASIARHATGRAVAGNSTEKATSPAEKGEPALEEAR